MATNHSSQRSGREDLRVAIRQINRRTTHLRYRRAKTARGDILRRRGCLRCGADQAHGRHADVHARLKLAVEFDALNLVNMQVLGRSGRGYSPLQLLQGSRSLQAGGW